MKLSQKRLDGETELFFQRELEKVKSQSYDVKYAGYTARSIFPISSDAGRGKTEIVYKQYSELGFAKYYNGNSKDIPVVNLKAKEFTSKVRPIVDAYVYSVFDVEKAAAANLALDPRSAVAARRAALMVENTTAFAGDAEYNLPGLFSNSNIPNVIASTGASAGTEFSTKTPEEIIADVNSLINDISTNSLAVENADSVAMPISIETYLSTRPYGAAMPGLTIMGFLKAAHPKIKNWYACPELETAGTGGTKAMFAYVKDDMHMTLEIPVEFEQLDPEYEGFDIKVNCRQDCGGLIVYYPLSVNIIYGV